MIRFLATVFAGLTGLAFGSFLNVCLTRWPVGESVAMPRSHCRSCGRTLTWWENVPVLSWLALRGRCRTCGVRISWRYPLVELAVGALWACSIWNNSHALFNPENHAFSAALEITLSQMVLLWILVALAALDAEHLWLPDCVTLPGIALGLLASLTFIWGSTRAITIQPPLWRTVVGYLTGIVAAAGLILLIRWLYWLIRRREGIGLGDAKLMAMLAAWLGLQGALLAFAIGVVLGAAVGIAVLSRPRPVSAEEASGLTKLPLGTFLCIGGIVSTLWGQPLIAAYLRWSGFN